MRELKGHEARGQVRRRTRRARTRMPGALICTCVLLCLAEEKHALADRAISPTDELGDWAIESEFLCCGPGSRDEISVMRNGLSLQVWPLDGLAIGGNIARLTPERDSMLDPAITDLELNAGYITRLTSSLVTRGDLIVALPTGQSFGTTDRVGIEVKGLLGFSFTPRHDFFLRPVGGFSSGISKESTYAAGWSAGMAYQRPRFSLLLYGGNDWYFSRALSPQTGTAGGFYFGWEIGSGWTVGYRLDAREVPQNVGGQGAELVAGLAVSWVLFPGGRTNRLRREDPARGADWKWWNPDPRGL